jgi:hypothetical protein
MMRLDEANEMDHDLTCESNTMSEETTIPAPADTTVSAAGAQQKLRFDTANIKSTYCNVCNATSTREEVVINFGVNKTWDMGNRDLEVQLEHRIILSPPAAKRLHEMLTKLITEHETRYGELR